MLEGGDGKRETFSEAKKVETKPVMSQFALFPLLYFTQLLLHGQMPSRC
jgi:hypothetical protein